MPNGVMLARARRDDEDEEEDNDKGDDEGEDKDGDKDDEDDGHKDDEDHSGHNHGPGEHDKHDDKTGSSAAVAGATACLLTTLFSL